MIEKFKKRSEEAMSNIKNLDEFRASDTMVDFVFIIGKQLFENPLDKQGEDWLVKTGGKLTGAFAYLGQMSTRARAERDVYEQKRDEMTSELMLKYLDSKYKVTEARAKVKSEMVEIEQLINEKEAEKNQWENIVVACDRMTSFLQSALKVKQGERFKSANNYDNG